MNEVGHTNFVTIFLIIIFMATLFLVGMMFGSLWINSEIQKNELLKLTYKKHTLLEKCKNKLNNMNLHLPGKNKKETFSEPPGSKYSTKTGITKGLPPKIGKSVVFPMTGINGRYDFEINSYNREKQILNAVSEFYVPKNTVHAKLISGDETLIEWSQMSIENSLIKNGKYVLQPIKNGEPMPIYGDGQNKSIFLELQFSDGKEPSNIYSKISQHSVNNVNFRDGGIIVLEEKFFKNGRYHPGVINYSRDLPVKLKF